VKSNNVRFHPRAHARGFPAPEIYNAKEQAMPQRQLKRGQCRAHKPRKTVKMTEFWIERVLF
jgi:hypothetical protein